MSMAVLREPRGLTPVALEPPTAALSNTPRFNDGDVTAAQCGDALAQTRIYDSSHRYVRRLTNRMVGSQNGEDVTQQVFLQLYRSLHKYTGRSTFLTWMHRVAVNESLQHLRRLRREECLLHEWRPPAPCVTRFAEEEEREQLDQAIQALDPDLRAVFLLREVENLSYDQIAGALGIAAGTVGSRLSRGRRCLQRTLIELGFELRA